MTALRSMILLASVATAVAGAQQVPVRNIGPVTATSTDSLRGGVAIRGLSNGSVLVSEVARRRVLLFDSTLKHMTVAVDSTTPTYSTSLIPFGRDSTLFVDIPSLAMLVIDEHGKVARTISIPKTSDVSFISNAVGYGLPVIDTKGRLIYRATFPRIPVQTTLGPAVAARISIVSDSAPLVRADFETRKVDTIASVLAVPQVRTRGAVLDSSGPRMQLVQQDVQNPIAPADDWVGLADGTIAIIRAHDYHIDFVGANGSVRSSPKLPFAWQRITDTEKQHLADSLRPVYAEVATQALAAGVAVQTSFGLKRLARTLEPVPISEMADYMPPFFRGTARADFDGNVWILPRMSVALSSGFLYDVVNRAGELVERVRLPAGRTLAGFGPNVAYLVSYTDDKTTIEVVRIR